MALKGEYTSEYQLLGGEHQKEKLLFLYPACGFSPIWLEIMEAENWMSSIPLSKSTVSRQIIILPLSLDSQEFCK